MLSWHILQTSQKCSGPSLVSTRMIGPSFSVSPQIMQCIPSILEVKWEIICRKSCCDLVWACTYPWVGLIFLIFLAPFLLFLRDIFYHCLYYIILIRINKNEKNWLDKCRKTLRESRDSVQITPALPQRDWKTCELVGGLFPHHVRCGAWGGSPGLFQPWSNPWKVPLEHFSSSI